MARFGDRRTYMYQNKAVDQQIHLGEDLASLINSPVYAGNNGVVVYAEPLGIYGKTVILDHGMGVFSSYSHMSQIDVKVGDKLEKGATLGRTGTTGLAGRRPSPFRHQPPGRICGPPGMVGPPLAQGPGGRGLGQGGTGAAAATSGEAKPAMGKTKTAKTKTKGKAAKGKKKRN